MLPFAVGSFVGANSASGQGHRLSCRHVKRLLQTVTALLVAKMDTGLYTDILGFQEIEKPDALKPNGGMWYDLGGVQLHTGVEEMAGDNSKRHPAFEIDDVDRVRRYLERRGVVTQDEIPIPGVKRFSLFDPFGNRIELLERKREASRR